MKKEEERGKIRNNEKEHEKEKWGKKVETQLAQLREEEEREDYRTRKEEGDDGEREEGEREDYRGEQERRGRMGKEEK